MHLDIDLILQVCLEFSWLNLGIIVLRQHDPLEKGTRDGTGKAWPFDSAGPIFRG